MKRFRYGIGILAWVVVLILVGQYLFASRPLNGDVVALPESAGVVIGQQAGSGEFFAGEPATGGTQVYVSADGHGWHRLAGLLPGTLHELTSSTLAPDTIYAATDAGFFVTRDGETWTSIAMPTAVTALAMDPTMADMVYVATAEPALYRVTDMGTSRQRVAAEGLGDVQIQQLFVNAEESQIVLAATNRGLYRSESSGENWTSVDSLRGAVVVLAAATDNPDVVYAGTYDNGFYRSSDAGLTWEAANVGLNQAPGVSLAITALSTDPQRPGTLYAATGYVLGHTRRVLSPAGIYTSVDGGTDWVPVASFEPGAAVVTGLVPAEGGGVRAITADDVTTYAFDLDTATRDLVSADAATRLTAAKVLSIAATAQQRDVLLAHLGDENVQVGYYVARALTRLNDPQTVNALIARIENGSPAEQQRAIMALGEMRAQSAVPALIEVFQSDEGLASASARALANIGNDDAYAALIDALRDDAMTMRRQAAMAALERAGEPAVPPLLTALTAGDATLRANAAEVLGWIDAPAAIPALRPLLRDPVPAVRANAAWALGQLGDVSSLSALETMAREETNTRVRAAAEQAVAAIQAEPALPEVVPDEPVIDDTVSALPTVEITPRQLLWIALILLTIVGVTMFVIHNNRGRPGHGHAV